MKRYAVYYAPRAGAFARCASAWLGRDPANGQQVAHPDIAGINVAQITHEPRRYGFHGTIFAPFRAADGVDSRDVEQAVAALAARLAPVSCAGLKLENLDGFIALTPEGNDAAIMALAATVVEATNPLRAPLTRDEIARRRPDDLTKRQRDMLDLWGYPYVMDEFRFHLTLTDRLSDAQAAMAALHALFMPVVPRPFVIEDLCLFGEDHNGAFHLVHRYALTG